MKSDTKQLKQKKYNPATINERSEAMERKETKTKENMSRGISIYILAQKLFVFASIALVSVISVIINVVYIKNIFLQYIVIQCTLVYIPTTLHYIIIASQLYTYTITLFSSIVSSFSCIFFSLIVDYFLLNIHFSNILNFFLLFQSLVLLLQPIV